MPIDSLWGRRLVFLLIAAFPVLAATVKDGVGIVHALLLLLGLIYGWPAWRCLQPAEKRLFIGFAVFCGVAILSLLHTELLRNGISKLERYLYFPLMLPVYLLLRHLGVAAGRALLGGVVLAGFVYAFQAWYQTSVQGASVAAGAYNKIIFGDLAVWLLAMLLVALLTVAERPIHYIIGGMAMLAAAYAGLLSMARGAWLLLPVLLVMLLFIYRRNISRRGWRKIGILLVLLLAVLSIWQPERVVRGIENGITDIQRTLKDPMVRSSWGERLLMWRDAITIWRQEPLLGTGIGDFKLHRQQLKEQGLTQYPEAYAHAHNVYLHALAVTGLLGFLALVGLVFFYPLGLFYRYWSSASTPWLRFYALAGMVTVISFMVFGLSEGWLTRNAMVKSYLLGLVVLLAGCVVEQRGRNKAPA